MGLSKRFIRTDEKAGSVDLSILALPKDDFERPKNLSFRTTRGLWYILCPLDETQILPNNVLSPVSLEFGDAARWNGGIIEEAYLGLKFIKNWAIERHHFSAGNVAVVNDVITEGDRLMIDGHQTSPVDVAWTTEWIDPASGETGGMGYGRTLESGKTEIMWTRTLGNF